MRRVKVSDIGQVPDPGGKREKGWWAARCMTCKTWLTKFDFSADEARELAAKVPCKCTTEQGVLL